VIDATKHEIRQYLKRERNKALPAGVDFWDFDCRFGLTVEAATVAHPANVTALIDAIAQGAADGFYLELLAKPGHRVAKTAPVETS